MILQGAATDQLRKVYIESVKTTFSANGDKFHSFALNEIQRLGDIGDAVEPHLSFVRLRQLLT